MADRPSVMNNHILCFVVGLIGTEMVFVFDLYKTSFPHVFLEV